MKIVSIKELDTKQPGTWPIYYKVLVWVFIIVICVFLYKNFIYDDLISTQNSNKNQIQSLEYDYKTSYQYKVDLPLYKQEQKKLKAVLVGLLKYLPSQTEMPNLIDQIYYASQQNGLNFAKLIPSSQIKEKYYNIQPISLKTAVNYNSFDKFAEQLNKLPRIVNLPSFTLSAVKAYDTLVAIDTTLETYIYNHDLSMFDLGEKK